MPVISGLGLLTLLLATLSSGSAAPVQKYRIVATYPHSTDNFTEGFFYHDGLFYESTGLNGHSKVLVTEPETGRVVRSVQLPPQYFGEGIIDWGPNLLEWTWRSEVGFIYHRDTLAASGQFHYSGEGWGMTHDAKEIITSDGSSILRFRDPDTFREIRQLVVSENSQPIDQLNELEYIKGEIYSNIWHSDRIARISPRDGKVNGWIDLTGILPESEKLNGESVLNGIAYDAARDRIFVTGKQWPKIFEIKVLP